MSSAPPKLRRAFGQLLIDDVAVETAARLIRRHCKQRGGAALDALAKCRACKEKVPVEKISIATLRENRKGFFGTCIECAGKM